MSSRMQMRHCKLPIFELATPPILCDFTNNIVYSHQRKISLLKSFTVNRLLISSFLDGLPEILAEIKGLSRCCTRNYSCKNTLGFITRWKIIICGLYSWNIQQRTLVSVVLASWSPNAWYSNAMALKTHGIHHVSVTLMAKKLYGPHAY